MTDSTIPDRHGAVPARVPAQTKELIVGLVDDAVRGGAAHRNARSRTLPCWLKPTTISDTKSAPTHEQIRQARIEGLRQADQQRIDYHRHNHNNTPQEPA